MVPLFLLKVINSIFHGFQEYNFTIDLNFEEIVTEECFTEEKEWLKHYYKGIKEKKEDGAHKKKKKKDKERKRATVKQ